MSFLTYSFALTRPAIDGNGALTLPAVAGSPFSGRMHYVTGGSGQRFENVPEVAKAQRAEVLFLDDGAAPVRIGDLVTLPAALAAGAADGSLRKVIQVRAYEISLQIGLQRQPFTPLSCWIPQAEAARTQVGTLKVTDLAFDVGAPILGYLEPAPDMVKAAAFGKLDTRACIAFTLAPLALGTVLQDPRGDYWVAELPSDVWPLPGDCKTLMRHLVTVPAGIEFLGGPVIQPPPANAGPPPVSLPNAVLSLQAQLNALAATTADLRTTTADLRSQLMAFEPNPSPVPSVPITATVTLARPTQDTRYPVSITANTIITLPAALTGGGKLLFDFDSLGAFTCTFALNGTDAYRAALPPIVTGASFGLVCDAAGFWSIE